MELIAIYKLHETDVYISKTDTLNRSNFYSIFHFGAMFIFIQPMPIQSNHKSDCHINTHALISIAEA